MGVRERCSVCDKVTLGCRCPHEHTVRMVICDDCQPEAAGPVAETPCPHCDGACVCGCPCRSGGECPVIDYDEPEQVPSHHTERAEGQLFLHDVHSPGPKDQQFSYIMDSSRSPQEIVAFAAGVDYGVRKHLDLFIEVLRRTMDMHEHREATALMAALEESKARVEATAEHHRKVAENAQAVGVGKKPPHDV